MYIIIVVIGEYMETRRREMGFIEQLKEKAKHNKKDNCFAGRNGQTYI